MSVEHQIAIIFCGTKGLLRNIPVSRIREFQDGFLHHLDENHPAVLAKLKEGIWDDAIATALETTAKQLADNYR